MDLNERNLVTSRALVRVSTTLRSPLSLRTTIRLFGLVVLQSVLSCLDALFLIGFWGYRQLGCFRRLVLIPGMGNLALRGSTWSRWFLECFERWICPLWTRNGWCQLRGWVERSSLIGWGLCRLRCSWHQRISLEWYLISPRVWDLLWKHLWGLLQRGLYQGCRRLRIVVKRWRAPRGEHGLQCTIERMGGSSSLGPGLASMVLSRVLRRESSKSKLSWVMVMTFLILSCSNSMPKKPTASPLHSGLRKPICA